MDKVKEWERNLVNDGRDLVRAHAGALSFYGMVRVLSYTVGYLLTLRN